MGIALALLLLGLLGGLGYFGPFLPDLGSVLVAVAHRLVPGLRRELPRPKAKLAGLSVVVPCRNEAAQIVATLTKALAAASGTLPLEVVVADGNSSDGTPEAVEAQRWEQRGAVVRVVRYEGKQGRGGTLAAGVAAATYDGILMLHADTVLPKGFDVALREVLERPDTVLTFFDFAVELEGHDVPAKVARKLRNTGVAANLRSRWLWLPYGDQALACRKDSLDELGGVPEIPLMEDFVLVCRARKHALRRGLRLRRVKGPPAKCSPRRWLEQQIWKVTVLNWAICFAYSFLGVPPATLARWYYGR